MANFHIFNSVRRHPLTVVNGQLLDDYGVSIDTLVIVASDVFEGMSDALDRSIINARAAGAEVVIDWGMEPRLLLPGAQARLREAFQPDRFGGVTTWDAQGRLAGYSTEDGYTLKCKYQEDFESSWCLVEWTHRDGGRIEEVYDLDPKALVACEYSPGGGYPPVITRNDGAVLQRFSSNLEYERHGEAFHGKAVLFVSQCGISILRDEDRGLWALGHKGAKNLIDPPMEVKEFSAMLASKPAIIETILESLKPAND